jgi:hypothetical protein
MRCTSSKWCVYLPSSSSQNSQTRLTYPTQALRNIIGVIPTYMRPPYSSCTLACGCEADMAELGYHIAYFDLDTQDYLHDSPDLIQASKDLVDQAARGSPRDGNFLAIGHDIHPQTVYNLTEHVLLSLAPKKFVALGECLGDPRGNWYRTDARTTLGD